ncbi:lef1 [Artaxa digramma nucleopolyhedrovirus]|uniref:Lef1 n=1 Tax=Artaxa digramma nucleopolyhedrovirus TaxID=3070910 RepID=A0AAE6R6K0_9ABAC|nr:lef1 [Euproctis digramma nucleopolyhedrovirus]QHB21793.1 lef1 [Artaxa digramma nucleopolyhedrovirus]
MFKFSGENTNNKTEEFIVRYSECQAKQMWDAIAYNTCRQYVFFDGKQWLHCKTFFENFAHFYRFLCKNNVSDVHVKAVSDNGGREWVIDVDFKDKNSDTLKAKIAVAHKTFKHFYDDSVARIMHSGNRGIHVWLKIDRFRMNADKQLRNRVYKTFVKPKIIILKKIQPGSFMYSLRTALESEDIRAMLTKLHTNETCQQIDYDCRLKQLMNDYWPEVDAHVFCHLNQIRAPFSFNSKGKQFSRQLC